MKYITLILLALVLSIVQSVNAKSWSQAYDSLQFNKPVEELILIYFSGSDWCKPCIKMQTEILDTEPFLNYAKDFTLYQADFPYRKKLDKAHKKFNESLAEKYNKDGVFPYLVVVNGQGKQVYATSYVDVEIPAFIQRVKDGISGK